MRSVVFCLFLAVVFAGAVEAGPLTEEDFLKSLDATHPARLVLDRELGEALAAERAASALANPDFNLEREAWGEVAQQTTMTLSWAPPILGGRGPRRAAAQAGVDEARHRADVRRLDLRTRARAAYARWWSATEEVSVLTRQSNLVGTVVDRIRNRAADGEESGLTARRFELAHLRLRADLVRAEVDLLRAQAEMQAWYDSWDGAWEPVRPLLPGNAMGLGWEEKPEIQALQAGVRAAENRKKAAGRFLHFPSLEFGWVSAEGVEGPLAGLVWNVPLFDRNQSQRTRASSELSFSEGELEIGIRRARSEIAAATRSYETMETAAREAWASTEDTDSLLEAAQASFQAGESTDTDFLEILRSILEAKLSALDLYSEALGAHRSLEVAAGKPMAAGESQ
jgi:cobalt-zinc-cadmium efflux system outer membrane protein